MRKKKHNHGLFSRQLTLPAHPIRYFSPPRSISPHRFDLILNPHSAPQTPTGTVFIIPHRSTNTHLTPNSNPPSIVNGTYCFRAGKRSRACEWKWERIQTVNASYRGRNHRHRYRHDRRIHLVHTPPTRASPSRTWRNERADAGYADATCAKTELYG